MEKPNRAERRKSKFGGGRATEHGGWPTIQPNPALTGEAPAADAPAGDAPAAKATEGEVPPAATDSDTGTPAKA